MEKEVRRLKKIHLALAVAEGESIAEWARHNGVPERTAQRWAQDRNVRREVDACRRRALNPGAPAILGGLFLIHTASNRRNSCALPPPNV